MLSSIPVQNLSTCLSLEDIRHYLAEDNYDVSPSASESTRTSSGTTTSVKHTMSAPPPRSQVHRQLRSLSGDYSVVEPLAQYLFWKSAVRKRTTIARPHSVASICSRNSDEWSRGLRFLCSELDAVTGIEEIVDLPGI